MPLWVGLLVGLLAALPFLQYSGLPAGTDMELHIHRIAELGHSVRAGSLYPRWAPNFYHGFGYPIFNYYAPLTYHLGYWLTLGRPELAAEAARLLYILLFVAGAAGAYLLGRDCAGRGGGEGAGLLGALAFSFAPYIQFFNPHIRGDLAESLALAALPWALWGWELFWRRGGRRAITVAVAATAAVFLSHNLTGLTCVTLIGALCLWHWQGRQHLRMRHAVWVAGAFVLLTAFFWLPFLVERPAIQLDVAGEGHYDFRGHFVSLRELLAPLSPVDRRAAAPNMPMTLGPQLVLLALLGSGLAVWHHGPRRAFRELGFYALSALLLAWLVLSASQPLWEALPGIDYYQFPWRFVGPLAVLLVPLIGSVAGAAPPRAPVYAVGRAALAGGAAFVILLGAMPGLYPLPWEPGFGLITPQALIDAELEGRWRGTTSTNDFVPSTVDMIPGPQESVLASYRAFLPVDRVNRPTVPATASVRLLPDKPWINRVEVQSDTPFVLRLFLFDFPGWRADVDGVRVPIELARPEGFVTVPVPAGAHTVTVRFGSTPARSLGWALAALGVGLFSLLLVRARPWEDAGAPFPGRRTAAPRTAAPRTAASLLGGIAVVGLMIVWKVAVADPAGLFVASSGPNEAAAATYQQQADLNGEFALLGYDLSATHLRPGQLLEVESYWQAQRVVTRTYQSFVHLVYPEGTIWAQSDHLNPAGHPTNLWPTDRYLLDKHSLRLPADMPAGSYLLVVGLYTLEDHARLPVETATCGRRVDSVVLCQPITVRK
jgi:hypothetical protein